MMYPSNFLETFNMHNSQSTVNVNTRKPIKNVDARLLKKGGA